MTQKSIPPSCLFDNLRLSTMSFAVHLVCGGTGFPPSQPDLAFLSTFHPNSLGNVLGSVGLRPNDWSNGRNFFPLFRALFFFLFVRFSSVVTFSRETNLPTGFFLLCGPPTASFFFWGVRPGWGTPSWKDSLPYDPNGTPKCLKKRRIVVGGAPFFVWSP